MKIGFFELDDILYGDQSPLRFSLAIDKYYEACADKIKACKTDFSECYSLKKIPPYNCKTRYYKKLVTTGVCKSCSIHIKTITEALSESHIAYLYNAILEKALPNRLRDVAHIIRDHGLQHIDGRQSPPEEDPKNTNFCNAWIFQLLKVNLLKCYLELQARFHNIPVDKKMELDDLYCFFLKELPPENVLISRISRQADMAACGSRQVNYIEDSGAVEYPSKGNNKSPKERKGNIVNKPCSFGYKHADKDRLRIVIVNLNESIGLLDSRYSTVYDFIELLTANDISCVRQQLKLNCQTGQFRYILNKLQPHFRALTLINIERSGKFLTRNGRLLTASNLARNNPEKPEQKHLIDRIFRNF